MKLKILFFLFSIVFLYSCQSVPKNVTYFQDVKDSINQKQISTLNYVEYEPRIKKSDALIITVSSPNMNQELIAQFNLPTVSYLAPGEKVANQSTTMQTYIVDKNGDVNFPVIGKVKVGGLTLSEATDTMTVKVEEYIKDPIINMNIISFKVSVLGEVRNPGTVVVTNSRITILDAIGAAGDLTIYGNRQNVKLIRDNNGQQEIAYFDLTTGEIFSSPYFYLQQNDVIVVDPNDTRKKDSKYGQSQYYRLSVIGSIVSVLSVIASATITIYTVAKKK